LIEGGEYPVVARRSVGPEKGLADNVDDHISVYCVRLHSIVHDLETWACWDET